MVRREPLHPAAQRSRFPSGHYRYWGFLTDQQGDTAQMDKLMRSHADVEDAVCRLKHSGLSRMPSADRDANSTWAALCMVGLTVVHWFQTACLTGALRRAAPNGSAGSSGTCPPSCAAPADASCCACPNSTPAPEHSSPSPTHADSPTHPTSAHPRPSGPAPPRPSTHPNPPRTPNRGHQRPATPPAAPQQAQTAKRNTQHTQKDPQQNSRE